MRLLAGILAISACIVGQVSGFYLPGTTPNNLNDGDSIILKANALTSVHTHLGQDYYDLAWCEPEKRQYKPEVHVLHTLPCLCHFSPAGTQHPQHPTSTSSTAPLYSH